MLEAIRRGRVEIMRLLLELDVDVNHSDISGNTPLLVAADFGHERLISQLLVMGAEVNCRNKVGSTPLIVAAKVFRRDICKQLVEACGDPEIPDSAGQTARSIVQTREPDLMSWIYEKKSSPAQRELAAINNSPYVPPSLVARLRQPRLQQQHSNNNNKWKRHGRKCGIA